MILRKKKKQESRAPRIEYNRPSSYHYSAKRSESDKLLGRGESAIEQAKTAALKKRLRDVPVVVALFMITASFLYIASLSTSAQIEVDGTQELLRDRSAIQPRANDILSSSIMNRSKLTLQDQRVMDELKKAFPEFANVSISTPVFRHRPVVSITLARPAVLLSSGNAIYLLDDQGRALFDTTRDKTSFNTTGLPLVQDQSTHKVELGKTALASTQVAYIEEIKRQSEQKGLKMESLILVSGGGELTVRYNGLGYFVKYNFFEDARKSAGTFLATKEKLEADNIKPTEYVDVRIPERAYIK